jgi:hypothetical protein
MVSKQEVVQSPQQPTEARLAAWGNVRRVWKAMKPPMVTQALLDAEQEAKETK